MNRSAFHAPRCPGSLKEGFTSYNPSTLRNLFNGKLVFHVLPEPLEESTWQKSRMKNDPVSGQQWFNIGLIKNRLVPDEQGSWVLKTIFPGTSDFRFLLEQPGNEHVCLQLARQVYDLEVIENALVFFPDGKPAIICRKFGENLQFSDFEQLQTRSGTGKKLTTFYQVAALIDKWCAANMIAKERFFRQVIFSWIIANGNSYANCSGLVKTEGGDYTLAPLVHTLCTRLHYLSPELSLPGGLFEGDQHTPEYRENGYYTRNEFMAFANRIGLLTHRVEKIIDDFVSQKDKAVELTDRAFLPEAARAVIKFNILERTNRLK